MSKIYHLGISQEQLQGASIAFVPGDPDRVPAIAESISEKPVKLAQKREFNTYLASFNNHPVVVTSTGIGGPSTAIAIEELAKLGVNTFIRIGTTGAIQKKIGVTEVIITTGSVRLDGTSTHYAPINYPAVPDFLVTSALVDAARAKGVKFHLGITASSDSFYPGQERYDTFNGYVIRDFQGSMAEWQKLNVLNYEMESSTLFTVCNALGLKAGCVAGVVVNRALSENISINDIKEAEENCIKVATGSLKFLCS